MLVLPINLKLASSFQFPFKTTGKALFNTSGYFVVPTGVKLLKILAVGGGGGACAGSGKFALLIT